MTYKCIITALLAALPLAAQDVTPELKTDITELIASSTALRVRSINSELGQAFALQHFLQQYEAVLNAGKEVEKPEDTPCPLATAMASSTLHRFATGDFDTTALLARLHQGIESAAVDEEEEMDRLNELYEKVADAYRPILRQREASKEAEILRLNATRPGVTTLSNGVQVEIEEGEGSIRDINRCTRETGVAFYTRSTRRITFEELPDAIQQVADELPPAKSWIFWVPAKTEEDIARDKARRKELLAQTRFHLLEALTGGQQEPAQTEEKAQQVDTQEEREPLLKIKVWQDDPESPVKTLPDTVEDLF